MAFPLVSQNPYPQIPNSVYLEITDLAIENRILNVRLASLASLPHYSSKVEIKKFSLSQAPNNSNKREARLD